MVDDVGSTLAGKGNTPLKFNIAPEKWWLEDYLPFRMAKS